MRLTRVLLICFGSAALVLGAFAVVGTVFAASQPKVTAVPVTLVAQNSLTPSECRSGKSLRVAFEWKGKPTEQQYYPYCDETHWAGETIHAFAASNNPSNIEARAEWILNPDEVDPFAILGPNDLPSFLASVASVFLIAGGSLVATGVLIGRADRSAPAA